MSNSVWRDLSVCVCVCVCVCVGNYRRPRSINLTSFSFCHVLYVQVWVRTHNGPPFLTFPIMHFCVVCLWIFFPQFFFLSCSFCKPLQFLFKLCLIGFSSRDCTMFPLFSCAECWINPSREVLIHITCSFSSHWLLIVHFAGASVGLFVCVISTLFILSVTILWQSSYDGSLPDCCKGQRMELENTQKKSKSESDKNMFIYFIYSFIVNISRMRIEVKMCLNLMRTMSM